MTTCPQRPRWSASLSALLDGEDPELPRDQVEAHLASCPACSQWLADAHAQARWLSQAIAPGRDLTAQLVGVTEAHICPCHTGGECLCTACVCEDCTCHG